MDISTMGTVLAIVVILLDNCPQRLTVVPPLHTHMECMRACLRVTKAGGVLGIVGMYVIPDFPAKDVLNALAVGIVSGLASTGVNQVYKQLGKAEIDPGGD